MLSIEESPLADIGIEVDNENLCSPDDAIIFLTDDTYLNPDTTSYLISIYAGEDNLIGTYNFNQSSLPDQSEGVLLDEINTSSCDFIYDDTSYNGTYKVQVEAFNICDSSSSVFSKFYYAEPAILSLQLIVLINVQVDGTHLPMILIYHKTILIIVLLNHLYFGNYLELKV